MAVLDRDVNPSIASHGGHAKLAAIEGATAYLRLGGGCQGCGMATVTLSQGIEVAITQTVPEINRVVDVTDHASGTNPYFEPFPSERLQPRDGRLRTMTSIKRYAAARRRGELNRGSVGRRLSPAIDARRGLIGQRPIARNSARVIGPRGRRYEYLTCSHDWDGSGARSTRSTASRAPAASTND